MAGAVDELLSAGGPWLVVAHGGVVRAGAAHVSRGDARRIGGPANASVTVLARERLVTYAWTPDLFAA